MYIVIVPKSTGKHFLFFLPIDQPPQKCGGLLLCLFIEVVYMALLKQCPRCKKLIPYGLEYCAQCAPIIEARRKAHLAESNKRYNKKRDPKYAQFYKSKAWRTLASRRLQLDNYRCRECGRIASEVDHIIPIQTPDGWEHRLDIDNTQALCTECHNKKHKRFMKRKDKGKDKAIN